MSHKCAVSGKSRLKGHSVSHSNIKTKRFQKANVQRKRIWIAEENRWVRVRVSANGLRTIAKLGAWEALRKV